MTDELIDIRRDPGRPDYVVDGAPGAMLIIISGPSGVGRTRSSTPSAGASARPDGTGSAITS